MVDAESASNHRPAVRPWRPGKAHAGIDIAVILVAEAGADTAESLRPAGGEIEWTRQPVLLVEQIEDGVAHAEVQREPWRPPELVLRVADVIILAQVIDRQRARQAGFIHHICRQILHRRKRNFSMVPGFLIHLNAANLRSKLEGMPAMNPGQVIDPRK